METNSQFHAPAAFPAGKNPPVQFEQQDWWIPGTACWFWKREVHVRVGNRTTIPRSSSRQPSHYKGYDSGHQNYIRPTTNIHSFCQQIFPLSSVY